MLELPSFITLKPRLKLKKPLHLHLTVAKRLMVKFANSNCSLLMVIRLNCIIPIPELMLVPTHFLYVLSYYGTVCQLLPFYYNT